VQKSTSSTSRLKLPDTQNFVEREQGEAIEQDSSVCSTTELTLPRELSLSPLQQTTTTAQVLSQLLFAEFFAYQQQLSLFLKLFMLETMFREKVCCRAPTTSRHF